MSKDRLNLEKSGIGRSGSGSKGVKPKLRIDAKELSEPKEKIKRIFESVTDGITITDIEGNIVDLNDKALQLSGFGTKVDIIGRNAFEFICERDLERAMENMENLLKQEVVGSANFNLLKADGSEYPTEISANI
jgi:PAS domain S-box-containing protein